MANPLNKYILATVLIGGAGTAFSTAVVNFSGDGNGSSLSSLSKSAGSTQENLRKIRHTLK